ncbi:RND transporter [Novimethylophilus kurashikiensis]|uniref:RND transporter n=1 Tax=Novimethylophilus kurashikiensis TaxID=1825523 RepID=A0A2R5FAB8_9PROT|nr:TolC family protein [Novimethylophilus kurashikiensis]GBG14769.1 RND transporter [Novimethylophilus kurashikiensis]
MASSKFTRKKTLLALALPLVLGGCATLSKDGGLDSVQRTTQERIGKDVQWARTAQEQEKLADRVNDLLKQQPLSADNAVQVALLNNKGLQSRFNDLGISEADLLQASELPNPSFSMLYASHNGEYKIEQSLTFNIFSLVTMPMAREVEQRRFEQTKRLATIDVLRLAADTRKAYYNAIAAEQSVAYSEQVQRAAEASAELAKKMVEAGNFSARDHAREQAFYAEAAAQQARARQQAVATREQLVRLMGLWGEQTSFKLPERLPDLPAAPTDQPDIEAKAMQQRIDLQALKQDIDALAKNLGLAKTTRFINVLEFGPARVLEGKRSDPYKKGVTISFELPIFDFGTAKVAKAEAIYMQSFNRAAEAAVNARSEVRESYYNYRSSYDLAKHYRDEIVPLRKRISDENMMRYNGMLISAFELLSDAQSQIASVNSYIEALRDFWVAQANLDMAMTGKLSAN